MQHIINQIHKRLIKDRNTVAVAESCTGGLLCSLLTQQPASSQYFILGVVAYSNKAKEVILKIPHSVLIKNGAVSKIVALRMAQSIRKIAKTDFGIGITGIAGPSGGTPEKPVGTVFIAIDSKNKNVRKKIAFGDNSKRFSVVGKVLYTFPHHKKFHFTGNRTAVRKKAALKALELLYENIYCY